MQAKSPGYLGFKARKNGQMRALGLEAARSTAVLSGQC